VSPASEDVRRSDATMYRGMTTVPENYHSGQDDASGGHRKNTRPSVRDGHGWWRLLPDTGKEALPFPAEQHVKWDGGVGCCQRRNFP
jgi:hypothetical protein